LLVVSRWLDSQIDVRPLDRKLQRKKVRLLDVSAIRGDCVDLTREIEPVDQTVATAPATARSNCDDTPIAHCPLALIARTFVSAIAPF
jgi:hypothetical protein